MKKSETFMDFIQEGLVHSSISLRELCRRAGTDPSFLSKVLRGRLPPPTDEKLLKRIAKVLQLDAITLIISTGRIPLELRTDPETTKRLLERKPVSHQSADAYQSFVTLTPAPELSEDLL